MRLAMKEISLPPRWFARLFATSPVYWVCLLGLCAAYIQGGIVKATDFNGAVAELAHFGLPPSSWLALGTIFTELVGSILILSNCYRWLGAFLLAGFTLTATFVANRFWEIPVSERFMVENAFFEHLGLVGGFLLVAWHDIRDGYQSQQRQQFASRQENVMINRSKLALLIAIAALFPASVAFAQTREAFGPVLPMIYDGQGGRHYCLYGYDGPFDPPFASRGEGNTIVCRSGLSLTPRFQGRRFTSPGARARAEAPK